MPELTWVGKEKVITHHLDVPYHVLEHQYSYDEQGQHNEDNNSQNMIIHGDNLETLKSLLPKYEGKVDCIYIDPPYNTGNKGWIYNDNVNDPKIRKWLGEVVGKEGEDLSRHDKWLCMMYPRLRLLRRLLAAGGVIFISIDDVEAASLQLICDEVFGKSCFVSDISWQRTYSTRNDSKGVPIEVEHLLVYSRQPGWNPNKLERTAEMDAKYKNPDNDRAPWRSSDAFAPGGSSHQGMVYAIQHPFTGDLIYPGIGNCWRYQQDEMLRIFSGWTDYELRDIHDSEKRAEVCGINPGEVKAGVQALMLSKPLDEARADAQAIYERGQWPRFYFTKGGQGGIARKTYLDSVGGALPTNFWPHEVAGHTDEAKKEIRAIFDGRVAFDTPKPTRLIERVLAVATDENSLVLDSFAGSGTTAHAVLNLNKADGGNRKFILVELGDYADSVTAERVRRAIAGYKDEQEEQVVLYDQKLTIETIKKGANIFDEASKVYEEALTQDFKKVSRPKVVTSVNGKSATASLQVVATRVHEHDISCTGGDFSYFELGDTLLNNGLINLAIDTSKVKEYVWFIETGTSMVTNDSSNPYFLGSYDHIAYHLMYEPESVTTLNAQYLYSLTDAERGDSLIIYADMCVMSENELRKSNVIFKKIPRDVTKL